MENRNKSKSSSELDGLDIFAIFVIIAIVLLAIDIGLFKHYEHKKYKYKYKCIAYIKFPGKESCMKEYKYYDIFEYGSMITLTLADGTKIATNTKNVTLVKSRKGINNGNK